MSRVTTALAAAASIALLTLAGCSVATPGSTSASGTSSTSAPSKAGAASPSAKAAGPFTFPTTCPSAAELASTLGIPTPPDPRVSSDSDGLSCIYSTATQGGAILFVQPDPNATKASIEAQVAAGSDTTVSLAPVTGLGDSAYTISKDGGPINGIFELRDGTSLYLVAGTNPSVSGLETIARQVMGG